MDKFNPFGLGKKTRHTRYNKTQKKAKKVKELSFEEVEAAKLKLQIAREEMLENGEVESAEYADELRQEVIRKARARWEGVITPPYQNVSIYEPRKVQAVAVRING